MAEEAVEEENDERPSFLLRLKSFFSAKDKDTRETFQRRLLDGRIERFLDAHFSDYISEYNLVTEIDVRSYEERYEELTTRIRLMESFSHDLDAEVTDLEQRLLRLAKAAHAHRTPRTTPAGHITKRVLAPAKDQAVGKKGRRIVRKAGPPPKKPT